MPKANDTSIYQYDLSISLMDYLFGSDFNDKKNKSYRIKDLIQLINGVNGKNNLQFIYSDGSNPDISQYNTGCFFTDTNEGDPLSFTQLIFNKSSLQPIDLTLLFQRLNELQDVVIKLDNPANPNNFFNFKIISIDDQMDYFVFEVEIFKDFYFGELLDETIYSVYFDIKSATESDPLKLDKADYTGNATDIDNRIIVLENLQNLDTNFTGQAFAVWTGVGYVYDVIYPDYYIQGVLYPGATEQKTLEASDAVNPRFDVFAVNATGAIVKTGIAEENPLVPTIDTETELLITSQLVVALSTEPTDNTLTQVYDENAEWTATSNNSSAVNFDATGTPYKGTKHGDIGAYVSGQSVKFTNSAPLSILDYTTLKFAISLKGNFGKTKKILVQVMNGSSPVSLSYYFGAGQNNFAHNIINSYQLIVIDFSSFTFTDTAFDGININFGSANSFGFRLDDVAIVNGSTVVSPTQKALTSIVTDSGIANATMKDDTFQFKGANGLVVSAIGKIITFTSNFTAGLKTNYDAAYAWVLANGANVMTHLSRTDNPHNVTKSQVGLSNVDNTSDADKPVSTAQQTALDLKLNAADYNQHFKGVYLTEAALNTAHPTASVGDYAQVNEAGAADVLNYNWDDEESVWIPNAVAGSGATNTDELPEGSTNLYWTVARFLANLTYANVIAALGFTPSTAPNDAQKNSDITKAEIEAKLTGEITTHTHAGISGGGVRVYNVKDYGALGDGSTDDTLKIQDTINACFAAGGGTVYFPNGVYAINGAVDASSNSQLYFPLNAFSSSVDLTTIKLLGEVSPNQYSNPFTSSGSNTPSEKGVILKSNLLSSGNIIGTRYQTVAWGDFNYLHAQIESICVRVRSLTSATPVAAQATGIDMRKICQFNAIDIEVSTTANMDVTVQPLSTVYGIRFPANNNFVSCSGINIMVNGMYVGIDAYEHTSLDRCFMDLCYIGITFNEGSHSSHATKLVIARCKYNIQALNNSRFVVENVSFEDDYAGYIATPTWNKTVYDIYEPSGIAYGVIKYHCVRSGYGVDYSVFTRSNSSNLELRCLKLNETTDNLITVVKIAVNTTLNNSYNGKVILLTTSCTLTLPDGLMTGFNYSVKTRAGVTLTYSLGGSVIILDNLGTTMAEKLSHTMANTSTANEYLSVGAL